MIPLHNKREYAKAAKALDIKQVSPEFTTERGIPYSSEGPQFQKANSFIIHDIAQLDEPVNHSIMEKLFSHLKKNNLSIIRKVLEEEVVFGTVEVWGKKKGHDAKEAKNINDYFDGSSVRQRKDSAAWTIDIVLKSTGGSLEKIEAFNQKVEGLKFNYEKFLSPAVIAELQKEYAPLYKKFQNIKRYRTPVVESEEGCKINGTYVFNAADGVFSLGFEKNSDILMLTNLHYKNDLKESISLLLTYDLARVNKDTCALLQREIEKKIVKRLFETSNNPTAKKIIQGEQVGLIERAGFLKKDFHHAGGDRGLWLALKRTLDQDRFYDVPGVIQITCLDTENSLVQEYLTEAKQHYRRSITQAYKKEGAVWLE
ncbi:MAG: hypothetical protein KDK61_08230 [Simkania sp.]|nr:hypothetical protein [Simkania sp.]